ncbi:L-cystine transporter [Tricharina praecox]|uniref:L-cystine transporter n=1 Tax=Tricharina praecox TaxID=43433 RepID=UPI00221F0EA3|nr:L-cystine transporter [Tricharina praecox]KAI5856960.1 L-cystine transporter [Tricharina praecox]
MSPPSQEPDQWTVLAHAVSRVLGWSYVLCWGISFYPQLLSNIKRRSVTGLALDYFVLNVVGFACYTVSCIAFLFFPVVRKEYADRHPDAPEPTVRGNDLAFAAHALVISMITLSQFWTSLWGYERHPTQKMSRPMKAFVAGCFAVVGISCACVDSDSWGWIDVVYTLTTLKLAISLLKYTPQFRLNYLRKSTVGWSIENILLDFSGGLLSLLQLLLDSSLQSDWSGVTGNPVKFFLSLIAMGFDLAFMWQHYVLYRVKGEGEEVEGERRGLLAQEERGDATV